MSTRSSGSADPRHIVVVGSMAVGKSTVGRALAARLGRPFRDSDDDLEAKRGLTGRALAEREGVDALHRWEAEHLLAALAGTQPAVVAAAASVVDDAACLAALREPFVVWLRAPAAVLAQRMVDGTGADDHRRPLGDDTAVAELQARRADRFAAVADLTIDTVADGTATSPDAIVATVLAALQPAAPGWGIGPLPPTP
jgi:shikimate kinase